MSLYTVIFGATYTSAVAADLGKTVVQGGNSGTLIWYDNTAKVWRVEATTFTSGVTTITTGTGGGTSTSVSNTVPVETRTQESLSIYPITASSIFITDLKVTLVSVVLDNIVSGSQCYITLTSTGAVLYAGSVSGTKLIIPNVQYFGDFTLNITVRKSSSAPKYLPFSTLATVTGAGANIYVSQVLDPIAV